MTDALELSLDRFTSKYVADDLDECLVWTGSKNPHGYGKIKIAGKWRAAHRLSYELFVGPIPEGLVVDHLCRVRSCVNPEHLRAVTNAENLMAAGSLSPAKRNAEATHCLNGHEFDEANTYIRKTGGRTCRVCLKERSRLFRANQSLTRASTPSPMGRATHSFDMDAPTPEPDEVAGPWQHATRAESYRRMAIVDELRAARRRKRRRNP